jgi:hypothetical protein
MNAIPQTQHDAAAPLEAADPTQHLMRVPLPELTTLVNNTKPSQAIAA